MFTMTAFIYIPSTLAFDKFIHMYWTGGPDGSTKSARGIETPRASCLGVGPRIRSLR